MMAVFWNLSDAIGQTLTGAALSGFSTEADFYRDLKLRELYPGIRVRGTVKDKDREFYFLEDYPTVGGAEHMYFETRLVY